MTIDRLNPTSHEQEFLENNLEISDNGRATWVRWKCNSDLGTTLEAVNHSLGELRTQGFRIHNNLQESLVQVVCRNKRTRQTSWFKYYKEGQLPVDLDLLNIPDKDCNPVQVEFHSSLMFVRLHLSNVEARELLEETAVNKVEVLTQYNMSGHIFDLVKSSVKNVEFSEDLQQHLRKSLSIYP
ncbi:MAG TPA: hypothetical protein VG895_05135 [Patescibacteria group bacterium]|nr:hypothetical protein [Patescibacteria group bacterium]